jgi:F0F1-type ATP synthase epsilon subunit
MGQEVATMKVDVLNLAERLYSGEAKAVTGYNEKGLFDILPMHSHFITEILKTIVVHTPEGEEKSFEVSRGILKVGDNEVKIFLGVDMLSKIGKVV